MFRGGSRARRLVRMLVSLLAGATALIVPGVLPGSPSPAEAAAGAVVPGRGVWLAGHNGFVGYYRAYVGGRWVKVYCVSPDRPAPTRVSLSTVSRLGSTTPAVAQQLAETLSAHGNAQTDRQAEAVSQALNEEIGNHDAVLRRASYLPDAVQALAMRYVVEARAEHGPYSLAVRLPASPLPGRTAHGSVRLRSAVAGAIGRVTLRHTANVRTPRTVRTDGAGRATFTYETTGTGAVRLSASAHVPPPTLRASAPDSRTQRMLSWSPAATVRAGAGYEWTAPGFAHGYHCSSECAGHPYVTLRACAPASRYASRIVFSYGGSTHRLQFAASSTRACRSYGVRLDDGVTVRAAWQYRSPAGWTAPVPAAGTFVVDCPPAPPVAVALSYDCTQAVLAVTLGRPDGTALVPLRNGTPHVMVLSVTGGLSGRYEILPGATAPVRTYPLQCGTHATVDIRSGVERTSGGYNWGAPAVVTTP